MVVSYRSAICYIYTKRHNTPTTTISVRTVGAVRLTPQARIPQHFQGVGHVHVVLLEEVVEELAIGANSIQIVCIEAI